MQKEYQEVKTCKNCGCQFEVFSVYQKKKKYCSDNCLRTATRLRENQKYHEERKKYKAEIAIKEKVENIIEVNLKAKDAGLHYGDYVGIMEQKKHPWKKHKVVDGKVVEC